MDYIQGHFLNDGHPPRPHCMLIPIHFQSLCGGQGKLHDPKYPRLTGLESNIGCQILGGSALHPPPPPPKLKGGGQLPTSL